MEKIKSSEILDEIFNKIENPDMAVVGPGISDELQIADASLFYYLNKLHDKEGNVTIVDKTPAFFDFYRHNITKLDFPVTDKISFLSSDVTFTDYAIKNRYNVASYHCTLPFISRTKDGIKKVIDSGLSTLKDKGKLIFISFCGESSYPPHKLFSETTKILNSHLSSDARLNIETFDIEDSYVIQNGARRETIWPYYGCNTMTIATKK